MRGRPGGEAYYPLCLRYQTSTRMTPDEAHALGLAQVAEITAEADALLKAQGLGEGTVGARMTALGKDPRWLYPNNDDGRAELLADLNAQVEAMRRRLPELFARAAADAGRSPPGAAGHRARRATRLRADRQPRRHAARRLLHQPCRHGDLAEVGAADADLPRERARPSPAVHARAGGRRHVAAAQDAADERLHRGLGAVRRAARRRDRHVPRFPARPARPAAVVPVPRRADRGRHRHALEGLESRAGRRVHGRDASAWRAARSKTRSTATASGPARPAATRSGTSSSCGCGRRPRRSSASASTCAASTTPC